MKVALSTYIILFLSLAGGSWALDLKSAPIQTQMSLLRYADKDDFDDFDDLNNADTTREKSGSNQQKAGEENSDRREVSVFRAGLYSALLPGLGEYYVGHHSKATVFFTVEAVGWLGFAAYRIYGGWRKTDLINYAAAHANAKLSDKSDDYIDLVGFYTDIDEYNAAGRVGDRERPYLPDIPEYHWRWQTNAEQGTFRYLKNRSREAYRRSKFMIGLLVLNRVVSIIDAVRDASRSRHVFDRSFSTPGQKSLQLAVDPFDTRNQVRLSWYPGF